jgi:hypothetical protein
MSLGDILKLVAPVVGQMSLASVRGRATKEQVQEWASTLETAARELRAVAERRRTGDGHGSNRS